jgi:two-component system, OmpR family, response regulator QseB
VSTFVLVVEDDGPIRRMLERTLVAEGYGVSSVGDGGAALAAIEQSVPDLLVLDIGLPGLDGLAVCRRLRDKGLALPILLLTARDAVADRVAGLDAGADDYVVKPFELTELAARIRALLRRRAGRAAPLLVCGAIELDPAAHEVRVRGEPVALSAREFALLEALLGRPGAILSRTQLEEKLYGWNEEVGSNAVEVHLHALRRKLPADTIRNVRGVGWTIPRRDPTER